MFLVVIARDPVSSEIGMPLLFVINIFDKPLKYYQREAKPGYFLVNMVTLVSIADKDLVCVER